MSFEPNDKTKKFTRHVKSLVEGGKATYLEIADNIEWDRSALSNVINGRRNVPADVFARFTNVYRALEVTDPAAGFEIALQNQAMLRVMLRAMAEVISKQREESMVKTLGDLEAAVKGEIQSLTGK